jgi:hypothetical protein
MKKLFLALFAFVAALSATACREGEIDTVHTEITFTINAYHQLTLDPVVPLIDITADIPGFASRTISDNVPAPARFTINSAQYPSASKQVYVVAQLVEPNPDVVLKCTWTAETPGGTRLSRDSSGGEGESYAGGAVECSYKA